MTFNQLLPDAPEININRICYNSKLVQPGDVFVAISGLQTDGHRYALDAEKRGAACVVCERDIDGLTIPAVKVANSRMALAEMAHRYYGEPTKGLKLIGITGTNGKTTVTYLIKSILEHSGNKVGLIGTNQNMIGDQVIHTQHTTPESLELMGLFRQMADAGCTYVVMEVSSHSLALGRVHGCTFDIAAFTNLSQDHLDFHGTMEQYLEAKTQLFSMCRQAVINTDDPCGKTLVGAASCPVLTYGINSGDVRATDIRLLPTGVSFTCLSQCIELGIPGEFSVYNALTAIGICTAAGIDIATIATALSSANGVKGRVEVVPTGRDFTVLIDYAHTPDGMKNILQTVRQLTAGRVVVLFGCGGNRDKTKRPKMGKIAGELADMCIVTSDNPRTEDPVEIIRDILSGMKDATAEYIVLENRRDAIRYALTHAQPDDVIVLAGKGHETYQVLEKETIHFDEREVIAQVLSELQ